MLIIVFLFPVYTDQPVSSASPPTRDKINSEDKARSRRGAAARDRRRWDPNSSQEGKNELIIINC